MSSSPPLVTIRLVGSVLAFALGASAAGWPADAAQNPAASMHELQDHFASCFHPSRAAANARVTFYFSLNSKGGIVAQPRIVLFGFKGKPTEKDSLISSYRTSFGACLPLGMKADFADSMPGKVYFLQYAVDASGETSEVLFRPFGSHGGGGSLYAPDLEPQPNTETVPLVNPGLSARPPPWAVRPWANRAYRFRTIGIGRPRVPQGPVRARPQR